MHNPLFFLMTRNVWFSNFRKVLYWVWYLCGFSFDYFENLFRNYLNVLYSYRIYQLQSLGITMRKKQKLTFEYLLGSRIQSHPVESSARLSNPVESSVMLKS